MTLHWLKGLFEEAKALFTESPPPPAPGLYAYPVPLEGGQRRIHLRVAPEGSGVLFADVSDVIHLNSTAAEMTKMALDEVPQSQARLRLQQRFRDVNVAQLSQELQGIYTMVAHLRAPETQCPTCAVAPWVEFNRVFSTPVHAPYKADVALTYACNNACPHCYNEAGRLTMPTLARENWFRVLEILADIGVPHLILTGGEPTLHPDLPDIIRYADQLGQIVGMNTNGRLLAHLSTMEELKNAGLNHVQITLESCHAEVHNTMVAAPAFAQTLQGIQNAVASGVHTITNTTLTRRNQGHAVDIVNFLYDVGLRTFAMNGMIYAGGGLDTHAALMSEELAAVLTAVRDRAAELDMRFLWYTVTDYCRFSPLALDLAPKRCNAAEYSICVEPNGDVLPCQSYYIAAGNLLEDPWDSIWNSELFLSFREREENPQAAGLPEKCWDCPDLEMCGGGCRLEREARIGHRAAEHGCARARVPQSPSAPLSTTSPIILATKG